MQALESSGISGHGRSQQCRRWCACLLGALLTLCGEGVVLVWESVRELKCVLCEKGGYVFFIFLLVRVGVLFVFVCGPPSFPLPFPSTHLFSFLMGVLILFLSNCEPTCGLQFIVEKEASWASNVNHGPRRHRSKVADIIVSRIVLGFWIEPRA